MFGWWGRTVARMRWAVIAAATIFVVVGVVWGTGVFNVLTPGGFNDPNSESTLVDTRITKELANQSADIVVLYSSTTATVEDASFKDAVTATVGRLKQRSEVGNVVNYYDTPAPSFVSRDKHATFVVISLAATDELHKREQLDAIRPTLTADGVTTEIGGPIPFNQVADKITEEDVAKGETVAMPVLLVLMALIFGSIVSASMPLLIGMFAVLGAFIATRLMSLGTDVSTFAISTITVLGLGMAIDYSLLVVGRFREELAAGHDGHEAAVRTMATAGRTVFVSGVTVILSLASLLIFPQVFLKSMGMGAMAAVGIALLGALTVLPALLAVLGPRINAWRVPVPGRRRREARAAERGVDHGLWWRVARGVMRRPLVSLAVVLGILMFLGSPFLHVNWGGADERSLPAGEEVRVVSQRLAAEFPAGTAGPIQVIVERASDAQVQDLVGRISAVPHVTGVQPVAQSGATTLLTVAYDGAPSGEDTYDAVRAIRDLPVSDGVEVLVGGRPATDIDVLATIEDRLPAMAVIMAAVTLLMLFFAFGSILLPITAVLMNVVSIGAAFGVIVWIFQDGHLSEWLGFTPTGSLEPQLPIFILAVVFALAADYEVFLLARVREEWDATGDNEHSIAVGLQRSGRIISAAAVLLIAVLGGFATGQIVYAKLIGIGMIVAIIIDATLVRTLLVPATMRLFGRWNWWAPGPLARVYRSYGIHESDDEPDARVQQPVPVP